MNQKELVTPLANQGIYILDTASWRVVRPVMDKSKCIECGICLSLCPVCSIVRENKKYQISYSYCKGCGLCAHECPKMAISMVPEHNAAGEGGK